ncbi:MAG: cupin domain-containing protein [Deltaproteobacteria bacterium]|nr:cupin domain-containing protein [Deltaproteobacteria bacterium]
MRRAALLAAALAACGHHAPPVATGSGSGSSGPSPRDELVGDGKAGEAADEAIAEEKRLAVIEGAMNALAPVASQCWAAAAADDYHLAGTVEMLIAFDDQGRASAKATKDTANDPVLTDCLTRVLTAYAWPRDRMAGQAVQLPFAFTAPHGQNTIDRRLVPKAGQGAQLQVLLDQTNSGDAAASMIEAAIDPGKALELATATRDEVWVFLDPAQVSGATGALTKVGALDLAYVAKGRTRRVVAPDAAGARVVILAVPGGGEDAARGGSLPATAQVAWPKGAKGPEIKLRAKATRYPRTGGATTILLESAAGKPVAASAGYLEIAAGAAVPEHQHEHEAELLYVLSGSGTMIVDGVTLPVGPTMVVQIPAGVPHSFTAAEAVTALQFYTPPGPEQRFKKAK